ncbi:MAG: hypothetical protein EOP50_20915, partial [Sphingobacteriales bacterium]
MKIMRINLLLGMLLILPMTLVAQKGKKKKEEPKPETTVPRPVAPVVDDTPVDEVPLDKTGKGIIIEFKPPYKYMLVLAENDEEGRYSHVFMTDSTLFPKRKVGYSKGIRRKVKPQDLLTPSSFRAGMEITFHYDHRQRTLQNTAKEIYDWWMQCKREGLTALIFAYSLGKSQRILAELMRYTDEEVLTHGSVENLTQIYREGGVKLLPTRKVKDAAEAGE